MIYVHIEAEKSERRGRASGNGWHDIDNVAEAIRRELELFDAVWADLGHGVAVTYRITVAPEASPRRTRGRNDWPLPVERVEADDGKHHEESRP